MHHHIATLKAVKDNLSALNHSSSHRMASLDGSLDGYTSSWKTDWSKCCQTHNKNEELKAPPIHYSCSDERDGYSMTATNLPLFQTINALPIVLDLSRLNDGLWNRRHTEKKQGKASPELSTNVQQHQARRARKRTSSSNNQPDEGHIKIRRTSLEGRESWCFLCEKEVPATEIRQAMTMLLNKRVTNCATRAEVSVL